MSHLRVGERWAWRCSVSVPSLPPCHHRFSLCITPPAAERCSSDQFSASVCVWILWRGGSPRSQTFQLKESWIWFCEGFNCDFASVRSRARNVGLIWTFHRSLRGLWTWVESITARIRQLITGECCFLTIDCTLSPDENVIILVSCFPLHFSVLVFCRFIGLYFDTFSSFLASNSSTCSFILNDTRWLVSESLQVMFRTSLRAFKAFRGGFPQVRVRTNFSWRHLMKPVALSDASVSLGRPPCAGVYDRNAWNVNCCHLYTYRGD